MKLVVISIREIVSQVIFKLLAEEKIVFKGRAGFCLGRSQHRIGITSPRMILDVIEGLSFLELAMA